METLLARSILVHRPVASKVQINVVATAIQVPSSVAVAKTSSKAERWMRSNILCRQRELKAYKTFFH